jgi:hypothetical protein
MEYIVTSPTKVGGKSTGEVFTEKELLEAGANINALIAAGIVTPATPATPAPKAPEVSQAPRVSEFKSNYEGDK